MFVVNCGVPKSTAAEVLLEMGANDYLTMLQLIPSLKTHVEFLRNLHGDTMMRDEETPPSPEK